MEHPSRTREELKAEFKTLCERVMEVHGSLHCGLAPDYHVREYARKIEAWVTTKDINDIMEEVQEAYNKNNNGRNTR